jgi:protein involved in polysaccharide export with SLBB domain/peptidoglycan hydrolase-like protein with peptidoglycan-binding domain
MNYIKELCSLSRLILVVFAGLSSACTSDFWPSRPQSSTSGQTAAQPPISLVPASSEQVARTQTLLTELGFAPGPVDGKEGPQTASAVRAYQSAAGLATDGRVSTSLLAHLTAASERRQVVSARSELAPLAYDPGPPETEVVGQAGPPIRGAVTAFQEAEGRTPDGQIDAALLPPLDSAGASGGATAATEPADEPVMVETEAPAAAETATQTATLEAEELVAEDEAPASEAPASEATAVEATRVDSTEALAAAEAATETSATETAGAESVAEVQDKPEEIAALEPEPKLLEAGDRVRVDYLGVEQKPLDLELEVAEDGTIALPDAGSIQAAGLGVDELGDKVMVKLIESYMDDVDINVELAGTGGQAADADGKTLAPGDRVLVSLAGATTVSSEVEVASNGALDVPEVGSIQASGLRLKELKEEINVRLLESYMSKLYVGVEQLP